MRWEGRMDGWMDGLDGLNESWMEEVEEVDVLLAGGSADLTTTRDKGR